MYYIPIILLIFFSLLEQFVNDKHKNLLYNIAFLLLFTMLCVRYGQGSDYFGYKYNYVNNDTHSEIGFLLLQRIFHHFNLSFEVLVFAVSTVQMICIYRAIRIFSPFKCLSLLLLYPTVYLTYMFSAMRQGIVIAFFLGVMLKWLLERKTKRYLIACALMASIHSVALILAFLPLIRKIEIKYYYVGVLMALWGGMFIYFAPTSWFSFISIGSFQYYLDKSGFSVSPFGLLERLVMQIIIVVLWRTLSDEGKLICPWKSMLYKVYLIGFAMSVLFFPWSMMSSRLSAMLKAVEIILIPILIKYNKKWRQILLFFIICYTLLMTTKNIGSYIQQGGYEDCNVFTYPYISIFNKDMIELRKGIDLKRLGLD